MSVSIRHPRQHVFTALATAAALSTAALGQYSPTGPFLGEVSETFESFNNYLFDADGFLVGGVNYLDPTTGIFFDIDANGTRATITNSAMAVYEPDFSDLFTGDAPFFLGTAGYAGTADGERALGIDDVDQFIDIEFDHGIVLFGGYFGAATGTPDGALVFGGSAGATKVLFDPVGILFEFFDEAGDLIGSEVVSYGSENFGDLIWAGWAFDNEQPLHSVRITGDFVVMDELQANLAELGDPGEPVDPEDPEEPNPLLSFLLWLLYILLKLFGFGG